MKSTLEIADMSAEGRAKLLKSTTTTAKNAKTIIAMVIVVAIEKGDFEAGEMNSYCQRITGVELRRELQGTYEAVAVLQAIRSGNLDMTEKEFVDCPDIGRVRLSSFLSKSPEKVAPALEIIRSKEDVTKRLNALKAGEKKPKADKEKAESEPSGIQTPEAEIPTVPGDTFFVPHNSILLNHKGILTRLIAEIKTAGTIEDCEAYRSMLDALLSYSETRQETLEAEAAGKATPVRELANAA